ncbi:cysteine desulfurase family protein [Corynebacterium uberis]|uniref:cysteine desulfurase family protein n=1 Tax=Corynebacterium TaxID=1716 RepID=UPI001D0A47D5|nr:cysteine desulfurase family protein [Corynebacterium uberis]UDL74468.1 cysteine desulfurase [Corynebacterium uberis]UDL76697.1 cysteine desulfurase [Corynebacterium uberis]UDL78910.1 cysteine desulfurase [Corynebacterium uberis]UDL83326.1 cysteine desulfurase [Corynebacterium uberis]UDL85534.1 cysteine desulfurase [Corynebacterium uberis]
MSTQHYLDHAATTPMREVAVRAWVDNAQALNPGGQYAAGRESRRILDESRERVAELLGADPVEVIFTASGTEADNIAVQGLFRASDRQRIVTTPIEHPAVAEAIAATGAQVDYLGVDSTGHVSQLAALDTPAALVACMMANNETGAIQPLDKVIAAAQATDTPVHVDAVQATGRVPIDFHALGATTLAASGHKFGGPRGVGVLLARRSPAPQALLFGGGQERGIRPGTNDVAGAAALAAALGEACAQLDEEATRLGGLRDRLRERILASIPDVVVNTHAPAMAGHLSVSFPGAEGDSLIMLLDAAGFAASTGSACHAGVNRASSVLLAMGVAEGPARGTVRFTLGRTTTDEDIDALVAQLPAIVERARVAGMA